MAYGNIVLKLKDSLSGQEKIFSPLQKRELKVYVCGITPYALSHIGHGRSYVNFDVLIRVLKFLNFVPTYIRNFTDIDDKLLQKATELLGNKMAYQEIAQKNIADFHSQMETLGCLAPNQEPLATTSISQVVTLVENLLAKGVAYRAGLDVLFDITKFSEYGKLSKKKLSELLAGARVAVTQDKRNPLDFVLWKGNAQQEFWHTSLGWGRPGWHIECSAMIFAQTKDLLDPQVDIHGGGADLLFPHHENEIAQSEAAFGKTLAGCWLHNGLLNIKEEKMSKSIGNSLAMAEFFKHHNPMAFRYYLLLHHYRSPIDFEEGKIAEVMPALKKLAALKNSLPDYAITEVNNIDKISLPQNISGQESLQKSLIEALLGAITNDLNTAKFLGLVFKNYEAIMNNASLKKIVVGIIESCLGLNLSSQASVETPSLQTNNTKEVVALVKQREKARAEKNWALADEIREKLTNMGYVVKDEKQR